MTHTVQRHVLVADDDANLLRLYSRTLQLAGYKVSEAPNGHRALELATEHAFDAIVSDISMPGMTGVQLLKAVREKDLDVPVVLATGDPDVETAMRAVDYGALRYLVKPVEPKALQEVVAFAVRVHDLAKAKRDAMALLGDRSREASDRAGLEASFEGALASLFMVYHPILNAGTRTVHAYEALLRSEDKRLPHPGAILEAAERLGTLHRLGQAIRAEVAQTIATMPDSCMMFVNLHPRDLEDDSLYSAVTPLAKYARRVVLEITERARLEGVLDMDDRLRALRSLGYRLAVDDLGAGYAGLQSFVQLRAEFVKVDMSLVRDIERHEAKQKTVASILGLCRDMSISVVLEGVETKSELDSLRRLGDAWVQGFLFGRPDRKLVTPTFE